MLEIDDLSTWSDELSAFLDDHIGCALHVDTHTIAVSFVGGCGSSLPRGAERNGEDRLVLITLGNLLFAVHSRVLQVVDKSNLSHVASRLLCAVITSIDKCRAVEDDGLDNVLRAL